MTIKYAITAIDTKQGEVKDLIREEYEYEYLGITAS